MAAFSNDAGDLWFEIHRPQEDQELTRWEVTARIIVFCDLELGGQTRGGSCTHDLLDLESHAFSPAQAIAMLSEHVETVARDLRLRSPDEFRGLRHETSCRLERPRRAAQITRAQQPIRSSASAQ